MKTPNKWSPWVLAPFWIIELIILSLVIILTAVQMNQGSAFSLSEWNPGAFYWLLFATLSVTLDVLIIMFYTRFTLKPVIYLVFHCFTTATWFAFFIYILVCGVPSWDDNGQEIMFATLLLITTAGQLAYGSSIVHMQRRGKLQSAITKDKASKPSQARRSERTHGPQPRILLEHLPKKPHFSDSPQPRILLEHLPKKPQLSAAPSPEMQTSQLSADKVDEVADPTIANSRDGLEPRRVVITPTAEVQPQESAYERFLRRYREQVYELTSSRQPGYADYLLGLSGNK